jgi:hypothetical protein
MSCRDR